MAMLDFFDMAIINFVDTVNSLVADTVIVDHVTSQMIEFVMLFVAATVVTYFVNFVPVNVQDVALNWD